MLFQETTTLIQSEDPKIVPLHVRLGKAHAIGRRSLLQADDYFKADVAVPKAFNAFKRKKAIPVQDWGNNEYGDCTIASEGLWSQVAERLEQRKTINLTKEEIIRVYKNMVERQYGKPFVDMGAYEIDALNNFRNRDYTFREYKKNSKGIIEEKPYTIDAYVRVNHNSVDAIKRALSVKLSP